MDDIYRELLNWTCEAIREADIDSLIHLADTVGIQDERLTTLGDIRERLILLNREQNGTSHKTLQQFASVHTEMAAKRDTLLEIVRNLIETVEQIPLGPLSEVLVKEGLLSKPDLATEMKTREELLENQESTVIVAGETNGGKSTFLNLLLDIDILPTDVMHCTFAICKIKYWPTFRISIRNFNGSRETHECRNEQEAKTLLKEKVTQDNMIARQAGPSIEEITLHLPSEILKSGVTLVDTPGIGEEEALDAITMNYAKSAHAAGFIYIIKSDAAGGVQEDRLLSFLCAIRDRFESDAVLENFDPKGAMFVCHRWDTIEEDQREKIKANALRRLEYVWPGFQPEQTFFFSTKDTMKHTPVDESDPKFITDSFHTLLLGLKELFDRASHNAIKHQYCWTKFILQPCSRHLQSMIARCNSSEEELDIYFQNVSQKQNKLFESAAENSQELKNELDARTRDLQDRVAAMLDLEAVDPREKMAFFEELLTSCSENNFLTNTKNIAQVDEWITESLLQYLDDMMYENNLVQDLETFVLEAIQHHMGLFKNQVSMIKHDLQRPQQKASGSRLSLSSSGDETSLNSSISSEISPESVVKLKHQFSNDPTSVENTVKSLLIRRKKNKSKIGGMLKSKSEIRTVALGKLKNLMLTMKPIKDPEEYLVKRYKKIAKDMREVPEILSSIVGSHTEWIRQCVTYAANSIPNFIEVNKTLMDEIREHRSMICENKEAVKQVMFGLEPIRMQLRGYGLLYMEDLSAEMVAFNIERRNSRVFIQPGALSMSARPNDDSGFIGCGSNQKSVRSDNNCFWARLRNATIAVDGVNLQFTVKSYTIAMSDTHRLAEIASLRCLENPNTAIFFGMTRIASNEKPDARNPEGKLSAFIFKGDLVSARTILGMAYTNWQLFVPKLLLQLLSGLSYIHRENLVHMELNLDTVMVDRDSGDVKLCQQCKPREARLPVNQKIQTGSCICLSPSVLQGNVYQPVDDSYAYGLILWEALFPKTPPFKEERIWPLADFVEQCHPVAMLQRSFSALEASDAVRTVLQGTLLLRRGTIPLTMEEIKSALVNIHEDPGVLRMKSRPIRPAFRKAHTSMEKIEAPKLEADEHKEHPSGAGSGVSIRISRSVGTVGDKARQSSEKPESETPVRPHRKRDELRLNNSRTPEAQCAHVSANVADSTTEAPCVDNERKRRTKHNHRMFSLNLEKSAKPQPDGGERRKTEPYLPVSLLSTAFNKKDKDKEKNAEAGKESEKGHGKKRNNKNKEEYIDKSKNRGKDTNRSKSAPSKAVGTLEMSSTHWYVDDGSFADSKSGATKRHDEVGWHTAVPHRPDKDKNDIDISCGTLQRGFANLFGTKHPDTYRTELSRNPCSFSKLAPNPKNDNFLSTPDLFHACSSSKAGELGQNSSIFQRDSPLRSSFRNQHRSRHSFHHLKLDPNETSTGEKTTLLLPAGEDEQHELLWRETWHVTRRQPVSIPESDLPSKSQQNPPVSSSACAPPFGILSGNTNTGWGHQGYDRDLPNKESTNLETSPVVEESGYNTSPRRGILRRSGGFDCSFHDDLANELLSVNVGERQGNSNNSSLTSGIGDSDASSTSESNSAVSHKLKTQSKDVVNIGDSLGSLDYCSQEQNFDSGMWMSSSRAHNLHLGSCLDLDSTRSFGSTDNPPLPSECPTSESIPKLASRPPAIDFSKLSFLEN